MRELPAEHLPPREGQDSKYSVFFLRIPQKSDIRPFQPPAECLHCETFKSFFDDRLNKVKPATKYKSAGNHGKA
jgi:hypothetical protein